MPRPAFTTPIDESDDEELLAAQALQPQGSEAPVPNLPAPPAENHPEDSTYVPQVAPPKLAGGTKPGSIRSTPAQGTSDYLTSLGNQQDIAREGGAVQENAGNQSADIHTSDAADKKQQDADFQTFLQESRLKQQSVSAQAQRAYDEFKRSSGSLKDPSEQYWADKGMARRVLSGFAAFASGFGQGVIGKGGNPYLDYLNKEIEHNFDAHKQNIRDLYESQVAAGKLSDDAQSWSRFEQQARLTHYELAGAHIKPELQAIADKTTGQTQRLLAANTVEGIDQQGIQAREGLAHQEALAAAAGLAAQRARQKEVREAFDKLYALHLPEHGNATPEEVANARVETFKDLQGRGYDRSDLNSMASGLGIPTDPKTGNFLPPTPKPPAESSTEPVHMDERGRIVVPSIDASGHMIKPEERAKLLEEAGKRVVIDAETGLPRLAVNERSIPTYTEHAQVYNHLKELTAQLEAAWKSGDEGTYHQKREAIIELAPKLYGYTRGPSGAQAGESGNLGSYSATVAGQLPENVPGAARSFGGTEGPAMRGSPIDIGNKQIAGWKDHMVGVHKSISDATFGRAPASPAAPTIRFTPDK